MAILWLHAALALVGVVMLLRQVLRFLALRARDDGDPRPVSPALLITGVNAVLALLILGVAVKGLVGVLIKG